MSWSPAAFDVNVELCAVGAARQFLDGTAIKIARRKIHVAKRATGRQHVVHQTDALEQLRPINVRNHAHAGDDVAHRDDARTLPLMLVVYDRIGRRSLRSQMLVEPGERGSDAGILITQPMNKLHGECFRQGRAFTLSKHD